MAPTYVRPPPGVTIWVSSMSLQIDGSLRWIDRESLTLSPHALCRTVRGVGRLFLPLGEATGDEDGEGKELDLHGEKIR